MTNIQRIHRRLLAAILTVAAIIVMAPGLARADGTQTTLDCQDDVATITVLVPADFYAVSGVFTVSFTNHGQPIGQVTSDRVVILPGVVRDIPLRTPFTVQSALLVDPNPDAGCAVGVADVVRATDVEILNETYREAHETTTTTAAAPSVGNIVGDGTCGWHDEDRTLDYNVNWQDVLSITNVGDLVDCQMEIHWWVDQINIFQLPNDSATQALCVDELGGMWVPLPHTLKAGCSLDGAAVDRWRPAPSTQ